MNHSKAGNRFRRVSHMNVGWDNLLYLSEAILDPMVLVISLWAVALYHEGDVTPPYLILSLIVFSMTFPGASRLQLSATDLVRKILGGWFIIAGILLFFGYASRYIRHFDTDALVIWLWLAPLAQIALHVGFRLMAPLLRNLQMEQKRCVIAGINDQGVALARDLLENPYITARLLGFFDDRGADRVTRPTDIAFLGTLTELPAYVKANQVQLIYLSLPMATQPRILTLLDALRDTTASIYFVPDIFVTDLIQGRMDTVGDTPVVAVCETPFTGLNGTIKRASDIVLALLILILLAVPMLAIAMAIRATSPGPVVFRQRRYGLDGENIVVYKFRSMTVCEDGGSIAQAQKNDCRITPLGAFLRKTSLDELPQFFNVLQGRMSIVGPRPHAVAHNELYRNLIKGYMIRHKVKPGITGWAQVNGLRGETDTLDKMKRRIDYDLDYLRHWSLRLDLQIIFRTIGVVLKGQNAY
jgi:putative colanic acid biosynthesis UDP-glucose lipid carrier transferase